MKNTIELFYLYENALIRAVQSDFQKDSKTSKLAWESSKRLRKQILEKLEDV